MSREDMAARLLAQKVILTELTAADKQTRLDARQDFTKVGQREPGELNGELLGTVALTAGSTYWTVTDPETFLRWVSAKYPDEIELAVRSSFRDAVLAECKKYGGVLIKDDTGQPTGEVVDVPGVSSRKSEPTLRVTPNSEASRIVHGWLGAAAEQLGIEAS